MIHMKDGLVTAMVLRHAVVLLLLTHSCGGQSQVIGPSQPVVAMIGGDTILPCHLEPAVDAVGLTMEWARLDLDPRFVYLRRDGVELQNEKHPSYTGRTSMSIGKLKCGDISLKLSTVRPSDAGTYRCLVPKFTTRSIELTVGSVSSPAIKISIVSDGVVLQCESAGWYPEPEVLWLDAEGTLLPAGPTETVRGPDDLYTVRRKLTVESSSSFTCRVQQRNISQSREAQIHVPADVFMVQANPAVRITIILLVVFLMSCVAAALVCRQNQTKTERQNEPGNNIELQLLMERRDADLSMSDGERAKHLDLKKAKLEDELQKTEEELAHVQDVVNTLTEQKKELTNQRQKLTSLQQQEKTQMHVIDKKVSKAIMTTTKEKHEKKREDVTWRHTEHEELLENTDKLLETTHQMIITMTGKKTKLELDKKHMMNLLRETERERDEVERKLQAERDQGTLDQGSNNPARGPSEMMAGLVNDPPGDFKDSLGANDPTRGQIPGAPHQSVRTEEAFRTKRLQVSPAASQMDLSVTMTRMPESPHRPAGHVSEELEVSPHQGHCCLTCAA